MNSPILTSQKGSFARFTIMERVPLIVEELLSGNRFSSRIEMKLQILQESIPYGLMEPLSPGYPNAKDINQYLKDHPGTSWLNAPFLFIENYLYHKISEICQFFDNRFDYFLYKKKADIHKSFSKIVGYLQEIESINTFSEICWLNLMGNKADLSQNSTYYTADSSSTLLIDHRSEAGQKLYYCSQIDIVLDNAGEELFFDLLLVYWLISKSPIVKVKLHFKQMPYFVSDALIGDYRLLLKILIENKETAWFAREIIKMEETGSLELKDDPFWTSGQLYNQMPETLLEELSFSDLIIFKGDLNYRRLVGDNNMSYEKETASLVNYFSADILISRILKSEVMVGLTSDNIPDRVETDWMFNGKFGQIEMVRGRNR